jgi:hypothetical protein
MSPGEQHEGKAEKFQHKFKQASAKAHVVKRSASLDVLCAYQYFAVVIIGRAS